MFPLQFKEELPEPVAREFDQLLAKIKSFLLEEHNEDGTHRDEVEATTSSGTTITYSPAEADGHRWRRGPWTFDEAGNNVHTIGLRPPDMPGGTVNDYNPPGLDKAVILELTPTTSLTLTGIARTERIKRLLIVGNKGTSGITITLKHSNSGSALANRFGLPDDTDIVMASGQYCWLYYDAGSEIWRAFITPHQSGGLASPIKMVQTNITDAQIRALGGTPITIIPAPGAGLVAVPMSITIEKDASAGVYVGNPSLVVRYSGIGTNLTNAAYALTFTSTTDANATHTASYDLLNATPSNTAVVLTHTAAEMTGGNSANTLRVTAMYYTTSAI